MLISSVTLPNRNGVCTPKPVFRIADHIASAEPVGGGNHLYKALRSDGRTSAVQVFPVVMNPEQYSSFLRQVNLLSDAESHHRASVPAILGWGFTQTGNFSFIEREWIEGFDLTQLPNREKSVTVDEIGTIAEQISRVLTLCHAVEVVHENISGQSILWDQKREQYCLTGFGFGLQTLEPDVKKIHSNKSEREPVTSKEKDVHDLGLVLIQLLREHLLRDNRMSLSQPGNSLLDKELKDGSAMPAWLAICLSRAVGTNEDRFTSAHEMYSYILLHHKTPVPANKWYRSKPQQASKLRVRTAPKAVRPAQQRLQSVVSSGLKRGRQEMRFVFDRRIAAGLVIAAVLAGFSIIAQNRENKRNHLLTPGVIGNTTQQDTSAIEEAPEQNIPPVEKKKTTPVKKAEKKKVVAQKAPVDDSTTKQEAGTGDLGAYKVRGRAYFHNEPDEATKRNAFIVHWNNAVLHPLKEENDFVYVVFTNDEGQTSKGWLRKKDLVKL